MGTVGIAYRVVSAEVARGAIARTIMGDVVNRRNVGSIELQTHQVQALARIRDALSIHKIALLCDPVGTGKTFTALAAVPRDSIRPLVIAPAVLRTMWLAAAGKAGVTISFASFESLSRETLPKESDFVIVDEAHHARTSNTVRYRTLAAIVANSPTVMLTATPVHNRRRDIESLLRLKLGERAAALTDEALGQCIVRRDELTRALPLPQVLPVIWHELSPDERFPTLLFSLPPPLPPSDGGDEGALVIHSLVRQWASTEAALHAALKRRLARANALIAALEDGTWPTRRELKSWITEDTDTQLSFAGFLAAPFGDSAALLGIVKSHRAAVKDLLDAMSTHSKADEERAQRIQMIRRQNPDARIVVFSSFAESVDAMYRRLAAAGGVAALNSNGARVAGGRISRREAIERFAPRASGARAARASDEITLLITTDLLSEGVNLQDASIVIHLDLPWTPARIEQRVGRLARIGSLNREVTVHAFRPPAPSEHFVHIERVLGAKSEVARVESDRQKLSEEIRARLRSWVIPTDCSDLVVGTVHAGVDGFVAAYRSGKRAGLVASVGVCLTDSPAVILSALERCRSPEASARPGEIQQALFRIREWAESSAALEQAGETTGTRCVRRLAHRAVDAAVRNARSHERATIANLASEVRAKLRQSLSHFTETRLVAQLDVDPKNLHWLQGVRDILADHNRYVKSEVNITALILLRK